MSCNNVVIIYKSVPCQRLIVKFLCSIPFQMPWPFKPAACCFDQSCYLALCIVATKSWANSLADHACCSPYSRSPDQAQVLLSIPMLASKAQQRSLYSKAVAAAAHTLQGAPYCRLTLTSYPPSSQCHCCWRHQQTWTAHWTAPSLSWAPAMTPASRELHTSLCMLASYGAFSTSKFQRHQN